MSGERLLDRQRREAQGVSVEIISGYPGFLGTAGEWDATGSAAGSPFSRHGWTRTWLEHFAPSAVLRVLAVRRGPQPLAFAPFMAAPWRLAGFPVALWQSPVNEHAPRTEWPLDTDSGLAVDAVWGRLREHPDWEVLLLKNLVRGGTLDSLLGAAAESDGFLVSRWDSLLSPWLPVSGFADNLGAKFRANLRRRRRRLQAQGELRLLRVSAEDVLVPALETGLRLEASGWKGRQGSAIVCAGNTRAFYTSLATLAAREGSLAMYFLTVAGRPVAFHFGLVRHGCYYLLKPGYDESYASCSPGQLLVEEVLQDLARRGVNEFDFLGHNMPWKLDWTPRIRRHCWLFIIRPTRKGRLLHAARFRWGPQLKAWLRGMLKRAKRPDGASGEGGRS